MGEPAWFLFDGDCAFCSRCAEFARARVRPSAHVVPWQDADLDRLGVRATECEVAVQWIEPGLRRASGPEAIALLLRDSTVGFPAWKLLGAALRTPPLLALAQPIYRWTARHRHRLPGGTPACALPRRQS